MGAWTNIKKLFGYQPKQDTTYRGSTIPSMGEMQSYKPARDVLMSMGEPQTYTRFGEQYKNLLYPKMRDIATTEYEMNTLPAVRGGLERAGVGNTAYGREQMAKTARGFGSDLSQAQLALLTQGAEIPQRMLPTQATGLRDLTGQEYGARKDLAAFDYGDYQNQQAIADARRKANQQAYANMFKTAGDIAGAVATGGASIPFSMASGRGVGGAMGAAQPSQGFNWNNALKRLGTGGSQSQIELLKLLLGL